MDKPTVVIIGTPDWSAAVDDQLQANYNIHHQRSRSGYVAHLTDTRTAMILVDGTQADWQVWVTAAKTNNATRRIPVVVAAGDRITRHDALVAGADLAVSPDELVNEVLSLVRDYARIEDPQRIEQLACECQEALPPLAVAGVEKFNAGEYYPQHDLFEEQWMNTEGPVRDLYRAILQVGIAYYQIERGNYRGALKMLLRSVQWLLILPDVCQGVNVRQLREDSFRVRAELEAMDPDDIEGFDRTLLRPVKLISEDDDGG